MKRNYRNVLCLATLSLFTTLCLSQPVTFHRDHLFPLKGNTMFTLATGVPYVVAAEYTYGVSDRFSVGIVTAYAPPAPAFGVRLRGILFQENESFRVFARMPILYYPPERTLFCGRPWVLAWPTINAEWKLSHGERLLLGAGVVGASCIHHLLGHHIDEKTAMFGVWNTATAGIAIPINDNLMFQAEASAVMSGAKLAGDDWVAKFPVIAVVGFSYSTF